MRFSFLAFVLILSSLVPRFASAATVYFGANDLTVPKGTMFEIGVFIDTEGADINAVSGRIPLPPSVHVDRIDDGASLLSLWVTRPHAEGSSVVYEGILPGGFTGDTLYLFSLFATADQPGDIVFSSTDGRILLNDGAGTDTSVRTASLKLTVSETGEIEETGEVDTEPPAPFTPVIVSEPTLYDGRATLLFSATDKGSGIDHYEVAEKRGGILAFFTPTSFVVAESPYLLLDQSERSEVYVRAIDGFGNVREAHLEPAQGMSAPEQAGLFGILFVIVTLVIALGRRKKLWRKRR
jgi:hypothetical protein